MAEDGATMRFELVAFLAGLGLVVGALWLQHRFGGERAEISPNGFVEMTLPNGWSAHGVTFWAPVSCSKEQLRRAEQIRDHLVSHGVPFTFERSLAYSGSEPPPDFPQIEALFKREPPIVFVHGRARSNPTPEEVEAEYRGVRADRL